MEPNQRVAVIGCGVAGLTAAHILQRQHRVTLFERNEYLGGHTHTVPIPDGPDAGTPVDTGFIVCNDQTYPLFHQLLNQLEVKVRTSDMSFSYHDEQTGFFYAGQGVNGLLAQRINVFKPGFWGMLRDITRFCRTGQAELASGTVPEVTIEEYVSRHGYGRGFLDWYLAPMMAAIWSTTPGEVLAFPAEALLRFFKNHGLLAIKNRPTWQTVIGGSHSYVKAFAEQFSGTVHRGIPIERVRRTSDAVRVKPAGQEEQPFDRVVLAAHADQAFAMLADPSDDERRLLGPWRYQDNRVVLHTDASVLPPRRRAWASWNYAREDSDEAVAPVSVTYDMNRLQGLQTKQRYCVSLNRRKPIPRDCVVRELHYMHPTYTFESMQTQAGLAKLNGRRNTYFCGSYFGNGFHEDAVHAAVEVGKAFGITL